MSNTCCGLPTIMDFLTGRFLPETGEEMVRQVIEKFLIEEKGWRREDIEVDRPLELHIDGHVEHGRVELLVRADGRPFMAVKSAPGSLVTREREALAAARLSGDSPPPLTVVTNGDDAEIMDTRTGKVLETGLDAIPDREEALAKIAHLGGHPLDRGKKEKETRIYLAFAGFQCAEDCS